MNINTLKNELESLLLITDWSPSKKQLQLIAERIKNLGENSNRRDVEQVVYDVYGSYECMMLEGFDNSDLTTLLLLATKIDSNND